MPKGYWIAHVDVRDLDAYKAYAASNAGPFHKYGARFLVRGGEFERAEGKSRSRHVVLEFADYPTALACYRSPEYRESMALRHGKADVDLVIIEGYDGVQP
jgi:uncharacterized protein (DUF1330 family)